MEGEEDQKKQIDNILFISQWIYFFFVLLIIIYASYTLMKVSLSSFDKSAIFIVTAYTCCLLTKCISLLIYNGYEEE